ncbi:MAG: hypothetical protein OEY64_13010 [Nitrospinota bacterium]|nr:hypothetical protein [Nitrospinota bacterium]
MKNTLFRIFGLALMLSAVSIYGCGDSLFTGVPGNGEGSPAAEEFDGVIKLDEGDYMSVLSQSNPNPIDYCAAAMGKAGYSAAGLVKMITAMNDTGGDMSAIFAITSDPKSIKYLKACKTNFLNDALAADPNNVEYRLMSRIISIPTITNAITALADAVSAAGGGTPIDITDGLDDAELQALGTSLVNDPYQRIDSNGDGVICGDANDNLVDKNGAACSPLDDKLLTTVANNLTDLVAVSGGSTDGSAVDTALSTVGSTFDANNDGTFSDDEISNYLATFGTTPAKPVM